MPYIKPAPGNEVVISGISGRYPSCHNIGDLKQGIMNKQDLVTDNSRWQTKYEEIPSRSGQLLDLEKFDAVFFGIHAKQADTMEPTSRLLLEIIYEAIVDAGCNLAELRNKRIGVVVGVSYCESERLLQQNSEKEKGAFVVGGYSRGMIANRVSYWLGINGPSYTVDTACSSSCYAMDQGYRMIVSGECDGVFVAGANLCILPFTTLHFSRLGVLSVDGSCKAFDESANGYVRSDSVCGIYMQRAKDAKRVYATVVHAKTNSDGYKKDGITFPSSIVQTQLLNEFYEECNVPPSLLNYLEAHGTGTRVGDPEEIRAIDAVICKNRTTPLKIGSVKSNMGHSEAGSGLCGVSKVIIAMETGIIPPNIHFKTPRDSLRGIVEGRLQVVTEKTPWDLGYAAVNNFGFGGSNAHVLLKSNPKEKVNKGAPNDDLSRVVAVSGRTEAAVNTLLDSVENVGLDVEYIRLLHDVYIHNIPKNNYRGYAIVGSKHTLTKTREVVSYDEAVRPIWFVFSGMGSQWPGMGKMLMRYPVFAEAIRKCDAVLKPRGLDIVQIISDTDENIFNNIMNCFVGIAAVQIGLVDLITAVGIVPDRIIGHSVGELGCGYADGCFTAEQMILAAYARGLASNETEMPKGAMAAVALGAETVKKMCPADIDVACHNSSTSSTISGPSASIEKFVAELTEKKIFAKSVATSNIAYHSRYVANAGPRLRNYLQKIIPTPKARSEKWLSSSVPEKNWSTEAAKYCSAEYHTNNLLSPVLFEETAKHIPNNAICIELAPHGLLQAILKRTLPPETLNVPLTLRGHKDNAEFFAQALGKLYNAGLQPKLANIYPPVSFPVSRGTQMISPHIKWDHSTDHFVAYVEDKSKLASGERTVAMSSRDESYEYMSGHVIDGRNLIPATGYLSLVWETLAMMKTTPQNRLSIVIEEAEFSRATTLSNEDPGTILTCMINKGTGDFGILDEDIAVVTGKVRVIANPSREMASAEFLTKPTGTEDLNSQDIYKELKIRGYDYQGLFQSLKSATVDGSKGHIAWHDNYVTFIDNMLQIKIFSVEKRLLYIPTSIRKIIIDTELHEKMAKSMGDKKEFPVYVYKDLDLIVSGGVQVFGLNVRSIPRRKVGGIPVLEEYKFVAHRDRGQISPKEMMILSSDFALEALPATGLKTLEVVDERDGILTKDLFSPILVDVLRDLPLVQPTAFISAIKTLYRDASFSSDIQFIQPDSLPPDGSVSIAIGQNLLAKGREQKLKQILITLRTGGLILTQEESMNNATISLASDIALDIIMEKCNGQKALLLLRKRPTTPMKSEVVTVSSKKMDWLEKVKGIMQRNATTESSMRLILVTQADRECGILGMVNCLRKEPGGEIVRAMIIENENTPKFALDNSFYAQQLQLDLPINVLKDGAWGSYRHLPLSPQQPKLCWHAYVDQMVRSDMSSLRWLEGPMKPADKPREQICTAYAALNFKDIMIATGRISEEVVFTRKNTTGAGSLLGFECSGVKANGDRVTGFLNMNGVSNMYHTDMGIFWKIPDNWSLEDAATVPAVYTTVCYAFYITTKVKKGEKILIHSGTGGVGQAAIHLALQEGMEVFTTVGTLEKRKFIRERFPSIPDDHIGNSRDTSFEFMIMKQTKGRGVDVVLNSLTEDKLLASVRCLAPYGRFLEIGKYDIAANNPLRMLVFLKEISFMSIMLDYTLTELGAHAKLAASIVQDFMDRGKIQPLPRKVFEKEEMEQAYRYMGTGKHMGKVLVKIAGDDVWSNKPFLAYPRFYCEKSRSYIIFGGLGGLGLEVAQWLCSRVARTLVLVSRRGITTGYQKYKIHQWQSQGVHVEVIKGKECWKREDCEYVLKAAAKLGPVDGIFNLAVQLKDALITNQTIESFEESLRPKVGITKQLDELTRTLCPKLRYFVVFSSVSCGRGTAGQTNYGYGNAVMERICERRVADGLPGLAIQWGAVGEVGLVASMQKGNRELNIAGTLQQKVSSCMQEMEGFLLQKHPVVSSMVVAEKQKSASMANNPLQAILNAMGVKNVNSVNKDTALGELGMDSVLAVEIKETLEREFDLFLTSAEIRNLNYRKLMMLSENKNPDGMNVQNTETDNGPDQDNDNLLWGSVNFLTIMITAAQNTSVTVDYPVPSDKSGARVFMIPGLTGYLKTFATIQNRIQFPATYLQLPHSDKYTTITSIAEYLLPYVTGKLLGVSEIILVGYSFGSVVALEIAKKLERLGKKLRIILIDGTPRLIKKVTDPENRLPSDSDMQNRILSFIARNSAPSAASEYALVLEKAKSFEEKVDVLVPKLDAPEVSIESRKAILKGMCARVLSSQHYRFDESTLLKSPITLLKVDRGHTKFPDGSHGLENVTTGTIKEYSIAGDHTTILENREIASAINNSLINT